MKASMACVFFLLSMGIPFHKGYAEGKSCGIEAAYGAVNALGIKPNLHFEELLTKEFISGRAGSSERDVCDAVAALGAEALFVEGMGWASLVGCKYPLILNVSSDGQLDATNHWMLFLGCDGAMARVVNGGGKVESWQLERLLVRWRGKGIIVSPNGESEIEKYSLNRSEVFALLTSIVGGIVLCSLLVRIAFAKAVKPFLSFAIMFLIVGYECASTCVLSKTAPPLLGSSTSRYVFATLYGASYSEIDLDGFVKLLEKSGNVLLIDCRYDTSYRAAHIPGTINIPVDAGTGTVAEILGGGTRSDQKIVLFCLSEGCGFAKVMATRLTGLGFSNLHIFPGGYKEWSEYVSGH